MKIKDLFLSEDTLMESRGLAGRTTGDRFVSDNGDVDMSFVEIDFYPDVGSYEEGELAAEVEKAEEENGSIYWVNKQPKKGGFALARFKTDDGKEWVYGRFYPRGIKPTKTENAWSNKNGIPGYHYDSKVAAKENAGLQPTEVLTNLTDLTGEDIVRQVGAKFGGKHPLTVATKAINAGVQLPIQIPKPDDESMSIDAFSNYFCEILHPIALQNGVYSGNAAEAAAVFLGEGGFEDTVISFDTSKTAGLSDSIMTSPDGLIIKVSSKAGAGASASIKNLGNALEDIKIAGNHKLLAKLSNTMEIIQAIMNGTAKTTPITLAEKFKIINSKEADQVRNLANMVADGTETFETVLKYGGGMSARLRRIFNARIVKDIHAANPFFHMLTGLAYLVADYINDPTKSSFSKDAATILSNAALVQVHTKAVEQKDKWVIKSFETRYPAKFDIKVIVDPTKAYASTNIKGNLTFKILKPGQPVRKFFVDTAKQLKQREAKKAAKQAPKVTARAKGGTKQGAPKGGARSKR